MSAREIVTERDAKNSSIFLPQIYSNATLMWYKNFCGKELISESVRKWILITSQYKNIKNSDRNFYNNQMFKINMLIIRKKFFIILW